MVDVKVFTGEQLAAVVPALTGSPLLYEYLEAVNGLLIQNVPGLADRQDVHAAVRLTVGRILSARLTVSPGVRSQTAGPFRVEAWRDVVGLFTEADWSVIRGLLGGRRDRRGSRGSFPTTPSYDHLFATPGGDRRVV